MVDTNEHKIFDFENDSDSMSGEEEDSKIEQIFCFKCGKYFDSDEFVNHYLLNNIEESDKSEHVQEPKILDELINKITLGEDCSDLIEEFNQESEMIYENKKLLTECSTECESQTDTGRTLSEDFLINTSENTNKILTKKSFNPNKIKKSLTFLKNVESQDLFFE